MADSGGLDGKDICTGILDIFGVEVANIKGVGGKDKKTCATSVGINLSMNEWSCDTAFGVAECTTYYTDGTVGSLQVGDHIYQDEECGECAETAFYSDNRCEGSQRSCFTVGVACAITRVDRCR